MNVSTTATTMAPDEASPTLPARGVVPDALIAAVVAALREHVRPLPQLLDQPDAMRYVGLARSTWFRLRSADEIPPPVTIPGTGPRWRRADLDKWLAKLKPARRKSRAAEVELN